jgi:hypothetical protein
MLRNGVIEVYDLPPVSVPAPKKPEMVAKKPGNRE